MLTRLCATSYALNSNALNSNALKNHFFSYQVSQLFIQLQGNKVLIDLGGRFHGSIAACSNNRPPPSLG